MELTGPEGMASNATSVAAFVLAAGLSAFSLPAAALVLRARPLLGLADAPDASAASAASSAAPSGMGDSALCPCLFPDMYLVISACIARPYGLEVNPWSAGHC